MFTIDFIVNYIHNSEPTVFRGISLSKYHDDSRAHKGF